MLREGPGLLRRWVDGGAFADKVRARSGLSLDTLERWAAPVAFEVGAQPWTSQSRLYPAPFPLLDRIVEATYGEESYIGVVAGIHGSLEKGMNHLRSSHFSLRQIGILEAPRFIGGRKIPAHVRQRFTGDFLYPSGWKALDKLALDAGFNSWIEAVFAVENEPGVYLPIPRASLRALLRLPPS